MFYLYEGDTKDLPTDEKHLNFRWSDDDILFSVTRRGRAALIHFTASRNALKSLIKATKEFCEYIFKECVWCDMILGLVDKRSVVKLGEKCGFEKIAEVDRTLIMMRIRKWEL